MRWSTPPDKREIALVFLSLAVYFLAYNFDPTTQVLGFDPGATQGALLRHMGLGKTQVIDRDGRKPPGWRDSLENEIFGDWRWDEGHIAGNGNERSQAKGADRHGATWLDQQAAGFSPMGGHEKTPGSRKVQDTVNDAVQRWGDDIPKTELVQHSPGYTILDNVFLFNGSVYLVTDSRHLLPPMIKMVSSVGNGFARWQVVSSAEGRQIMGAHGTSVRGVSWLSADPHPHNSTLFALWRTYSSLDPSITASGRSSLPPPTRLIFPHNRFFTDPNPPPEQKNAPRKRFETGIHPYLAKAAFPQITFQYYEDWIDYIEMEVPFVFERMVIADRRAARKSLGAGGNGGGAAGVTGMGEGLPVYAPAFETKTSRHWWEPIRKNLAFYLGEYDVIPSDPDPAPQSGSSGSSPSLSSFFSSSKSKKFNTRVVTFLDNHHEQHSHKLTDSDRNALIRALRQGAVEHGYELNIVAAHMGWQERMKAVVRSSVILGVHGYHLMDSVFMNPTPQTTLIEIFPPNKFRRDLEFAVRNLGFRYMAWSGGRYYDADEELPPISPLIQSSDELQIHARKIVQGVAASLSRNN